MLTFPVGYLSSSNGVDALDSVLSSVCCDLDATIADSYGGSGQTWANLIASPADGAGQTDYDFFRGVDGSSSTDDPTFTGTAGNDAAYWLHDGGDFFQIVNGNTTLLQDAHKTTGALPLTIGWAFRTPGTLTNALAMGTASSGSDHGWKFFLLGGGDDGRWYQRDGSVDAVTSMGSDPLIVINTDYLLLVSFDYTAGIFKYWLNSTTETTETLISNTTTTNAGQVFQLGAVSGVGHIDNDYRTYGFYMFNEILDDTKAALIFSHLETRHNRNYTP